MSEKIIPVLRESATFDRLSIQEIQRAAETGIYDIRGGGANRLPRLPRIGRHEDGDIAHDPQPCDVLDRMMRRSEFPIGDAARHAA